MIKFIINSKKGCLLGALLGLITFLFLFFSLKSVDTKVFFDFLFVACFPFILSGFISGSFVEGVIIERIIPNNHFLSKHKYGCIIGCLIVGICSFYLLLSFGLLGQLLGGILGELLQNKPIEFLGRIMGVTISSIIIILASSFFGMTLGAFIDLFFYTILGKNNA